MRNKATFAAMAVVAVTQVSLTTGTAAQDAAKGANKQIRDDLDTYSLEELLQLR